VRDPDEWQHVVLAQGVERNPGRDHQLVIAAVVRKGRRPERCGRQQFRVHACHAPRRIAEALVCQVDAEGVEQVMRSSLRRREIDVAAIAGCRHRQMGECLGHASLSDPWAASLTAVAA
jgi:hypothetical protein